MYAWLVATLFFAIAIIELIILLAQNRRIEAFVHALTQIRNICDSTHNQPSLAWKITQANSIAAAALARSEHLPPREP